MEFNLHNLVYNTTVRYTVTERIQSDTTRRRSDAEHEREMPAIPKKTSTQNATRLPIHQHRVSFNFNTVLRLIRRLLPSI